jgi:hypothetical protein
LRLDCASIALRLRFDCASIAQRAPSKQGIKPQAPKAKRPRTRKQGRFVVLGVAMQLHSCGFIHAASFIWLHPCSFKHQTNKRRPKFENLLKKFALIKTFVVTLYLGKIRGKFIVKNELKHLLSTNMSRCGNKPTQGSCHTRHKQSSGKVQAMH